MRAATRGHVPRAVAIAAGLGADLSVVTAYAKDSTDVKGRVLGSVASSVAHSASCDVSIVKTAQ